MLPARYRMTRSAEFGATVNYGMRAVQPDLVVHALSIDGADGGGPKIGLVVAKIRGELQCNDTECPVGFGTSPVR